jgi:hypothetical protein
MLPLIEFNGTIKFPNISDRVMSPKRHYSDLKTKVVTSVFKASDNKVYITTDSSNAKFIV